MSDETRGEMPQGEIPHDEMPQGEGPDATELLPGGGKPAEAKEPAGSAAPDSGDASTLPMPKPGMRPDEDTLRLDAGSEPPAESAPSGSEPSDAPDTTPGPASASAPEQVTAPEQAPAPASAASEPAPASASASGPATSRAKLGIAAAIALVVVAALVIWATYAAQLWGGRSLPDVTGMSAADARAVLEASGLSVEQRDTPADEGLGTVLDTDPDAGVRVRRGTTVIVHVGVPRVVPQVRGKALDEAKQALADAGVTNIRLEYKNSDEDEGSVLGVTPGEGSVVTADEEVTLEIAQPYTVPDVVGLTQDDATKALAEAGLLSKVEWREAEGDSYQVLETSPAAGTRVTSGSTVTVTVVAPGPRSETHLADYLTKDPRGISSYLSWKGWPFQFGTTVTGTGAFEGKGLAEEGWSKAGVGALTFTPEPNTGHHGIFLGSLLTQDVLASGAAIAGVRYVPDKQALGDATSVDSATVNTWATRTGLSGLVGVVSGDDVAKAMGITGSHADMLMGYGEQDGNVWSVMVTKGSGVVVTCAPASAYEGVDLAQYGNSIGIYMAYLEGFTG